METGSMNDTIGLNIKRCRQDRGMTQENLANKTMIQRTTISKYEKNVLTPPPDNLRAIEKALKLREGDLARKVAIAVPDTSALMRNKRLLKFLLEDYEQVVIADVVIVELSRLKNARITKHSSAQDKTNKKVSSRIMSMIDEYMRKYKGKIIKKSTGQYDVSGNDQRIIELAKDTRKQTSRAVEIIHFDKDFPLFADASITPVYLENYMAGRADAGTNYQKILNLDMEFNNLEQYEAEISKMNLDACLPDGMTLLISTIRCNEPNKTNERGGTVIPEALIRKKLLFLLEHGANPDKTDCHEYCHTPLEHCMERYKPDFKEFCILLEHGADYNKCSVDESQPGHKRISDINEGNTPLMIACFLGKEKWVRKLCSYPDICINSQDCNGYTPLIKCAVARWNRKNQGKSYDRYETIYHFLKDEMHADPLIRDRNNRTAQDWWNRPTKAEEEEYD